MRRKVTAMLVVFLVLVLGTLPGCATEDEGAGNAPSTTAQRTKTTTRTT